MTARQDQHPRRFGLTRRSARELSAAAALVAGVTAVLVAQSDLEEASVLEPDDTLTELLAARAAIQRGHDRAACSRLEAIASSLPTREYLAVAAGKVASQCGSRR